MYTRSYYSEDEKINVPENYNGTAIREPLENAPPEEAIESEPLRAPWDIPSDEASKASSEAVITKKDSDSSFFGNILRRLPISPKMLGGELFKLRLEKIGFEEILIIGIALILLFSKEADKECALMLLLLLFVK